MGASVAMRSLVGWKRVTGRCLTTGAPAGPSFEYKVQSPDDARPRKTCTVCGFINYENPKVVCGSVLTVKKAGGDLFVLGRRTIQPRIGYWGIPAGFLEIGETGEEGAAREAREEINAEIDVGGLLAVYTLPHIGQIQMIYSSVLKNAAQGTGGNLDKLRVSAGQETDEVMAVRWEDIPWDSLAFPTTSWALWHHRLRAEIAAAGPAPTALHASVSARPRSGATDGASGHETGVSAATGEEVGTEEGHDTMVPSGGVPADAVGSSAGAGLRISDGPVFSTPASSSSAFWSPGRGLHLKDGWNASIDS